LKKHYFNQLEFDPSDGSLINRSSGQETTLRPQVARLLETLLARANEVVSRDELSRAIWADNRIVDFEAGMAALVRELRQSLSSLDASADLLQTIPRRGYRLNVDTRDAPDQDWQGSNQPDDGEPGGLNAKPWLGVLALLLLVACVFAFWPDNNTGPERHALVILPFERYGDLHQAPEHTEFLVADTLLAKLWQANLPGLQLIGRSSVQAYTERADVARIVAEQLNANLILEGDLITEANGWRVEARLLVLPAGTVIWSDAVLVDEAEATVDLIAGQFVQALSEQWATLKESQ